MARMFLALAFAVAAVLGPGAVFGDGGATSASAAPCDHQQSENRGCAGTLAAGCAALCHAALLQLPQARPPQSTPLEVQHAPQRAPDAIEVQPPVPPPRLVAR